MIRKIPLHPAVVSYIQSEKGTEPIRFRYKDPIAFYLFSVLRQKKPGENYYKPTKNKDTIQLRLPTNYIKSNKVYPDKEMIRRIEDIFIEIIKEKVTTEVLMMVSQGGKPITYRKALHLILAKYHLKEWELSYETAWKRIQRQKKRIENN